MPNRDRPEDRTEAATEARAGSNLNEAGAEVLAARTEAADSGSNGDQDGWKSEFLLE